MKRKVLAILIAAAMGVSLAGCGGTSDRSEQLLNDVLGNAGSSESTSSFGSSDSADSSSTVDNGGGSAQSENDQTDPDVQGWEQSDGTWYYEGFLGDTFVTDWFDFTVNDAYFLDPAEVEGYTLSDGNVFLVAYVTLKSTYRSSIEIYYNDFQLQWGEDADDAYEYAIMPDEALIPGQIIDGASIGAGQTLSGFLLFEVPSGYKDFSISFLEFYSDDSEGDLFFCYFTVTENGAADSYSGTTGSDLTGNGIVTSEEEWQGWYEGTVKMEGFGGDYDWYSQTVDVYGFLVNPDGDDPFFELYSDDFDLFSNYSFNLEDDDALALVTVYVDLTDETATPREGNGYVIDMSLTQEEAEAFKMTSDGVNDVTLQTTFRYVDPEYDAGDNGIVMTFDVRKVDSL